MSDYGPLESATRTAISELDSLEGINRPLAELCIALSQRIDEGAAGMAVSAIGRELRETLTKMVEESDSGNAIDKLLAQFATPVVLTEVRNSETA
jgi:hypothetical protein